MHLISYSNSTIALWYSKGQVAPPRTCFMLLLRLKSIDILYNRTVSMLCIV